MALVPLGDLLSSRPSSPVDESTVCARRLGSESLETACAALSGPLWLWGRFWEICVFIFIIIFFCLAFLYFLWPN